MKVSQRAVFFALSAICASASAADSDLATVEITGGRTIVEVETARPLGMAVMALVERFAQPITYEDPRYVYEGDLVDVTERVRKDLDKYPPGKAPKVIGPRGGKLSVSSSSTDVAAVLDQLVQAQNSSGHGGHFRVERQGEFLHVIPTDVRDKSGNWAPQPSVLDVSISLEAEDRTALELVDTIRRAVSDAAGVKVVLGLGLSGGISTGKEPHYRLGAKNEPARSVLVRALTAIAVDRELLTWLLFYGAADNRYVLSLMPAFQGPQPPRTPESSGAADAPADAASRTQNGLSGSRSR